MYFYHGNKHYYLTRIFLADTVLRDTLYPLDLSNEDYDDLCYALADNLYEITDDFVKKNTLSANEYYDKERKNYLANSIYTAAELSRMQSAVDKITGKSYNWYMVANKPIYVGILKSLLYGAIKHFFYENKELYLPQYDWYLINQNPKRSEIINTLFLEYDKVATISDAIQYYQDPDDIPVEFIIRLQEITGLTMNTYGNTFTADQLRNLTKHLIDVWREKGSLFAIELFFSCMGIDCAVQELWFDRRLYFNTDNFNDYTTANSAASFGYYLTPRDPQSTTYSFSDENVSYNMYTSPKPSRMWEYLLKTSASSEDETVRELLGYEDSDRGVTYTFFKSNYLLFNFEYTNQTASVSKAELEVFKELVKHILPAYMRTIYANDYGSDTGGDDWDIFKSVDINDTGNAEIPFVRDLDKNIDRPAEIFKLFDVQNSLGNINDDNRPFSYSYSDRYKTGLVNSDGSPYQALIRDVYPPSVVGYNFVSGSYIIVNDTRLENFVDGNYYKTTDATIIEGKTYYTRSGSDPDYIYTPVENPVEEELGNYYQKNYKVAATSGVYDLISGNYSEHYGYIKTADKYIVDGKTYYTYDDENNEYDEVEEPDIEEIESYFERNVFYPVFYDDEGHNYFYTSDGHLEKDDWDWEEAENGDWTKGTGTIGTLFVSEEKDKSDNTPYPDGTSQSSYPNTITRYFFQVNNSDTEIYPVLFAGDNNGSRTVFEQGYYNKLFYDIVTDPKDYELDTYYEFVGASGPLDVGKTYYVYSNSEDKYVPVENPRESELSKYYEFVRTNDTQINPEEFKPYYTLNFLDETFSVSAEPQVDWTYDSWNSAENKWDVLPYETFDPQYTDKPQNLFETSSWRDNIPAINDLYTAGSFTHNIQYEYYEYSNPIQNVEADLKNPITITLI